MERAKRSESPVVRAVLQFAIEGAMPSITGRAGLAGFGTGLHGAPTRPNLPRELLKLRNEPTAGRAGAPRLPTTPRDPHRRDVPVTASAPHNGKRCTAMHRNAPLCTAGTRNTQNEPNLLPRRSPASVDVFYDRVAHAIPRPDLHQNAPKCTTQTSNTQNEPNSARDDPAAVATGGALSPRQLHAIALLFAGRSYTAVGRELKIDRSTLFRWRRSPAFAAEVRRRYAQTAEARSRRQAPALAWRGEVAFGEAAQTLGRGGEEK